MSRGDLRPVHPAALRLARVIEHAGGQLQVGFGKRIRRGRGREIRHRIIRCIQALGGCVLQTRDDALAAVAQFAGLRPQRRIFARGVEFLHRRPLGLAVEIAQRFCAQHVTQPVGNRLIRRRNIARRLDRLLGGLGGRCGGRSRRLRAGATVAVSFLLVSALAGVGLAGVGLARSCGLGGRNGGDIGRLWSPARPSPSPSPRRAPACPA